MTVLSACQSASVRLFGKKPSAVFSASDPTSLKLQDLANEAALEIAKTHDWQALTVLNTITGDGTSTAFDLPSDYDRIPLDSSPYDVTSRAWFYAVKSLDEWLDDQVSITAGVPGVWKIIGGQLNILPALGSSKTAKFYYQSNKIVTGSGGTNKSAFNMDDDEFRLPERLLTLGLIWMWRQRNGLDYAADLDAYNTTLAQEVVRDKAKKKLVVGRRRYPSDVKIAFPGVIEAS